MSNNFIKGRKLRESHLGSDYDKQGEMTEK